MTIAGSQCDVTHVTNTEIKCTTNGYSFSTIKALVQVYIKDGGFALNVTKEL